MATNNAHSSPLGPYEDWAIHYQMSADYGHLHQPRLSDRIEPADVAKPTAIPRMASFGTEKENQLHEFSLLRDELVNSSAHHYNNNIQDGTTHSPLLSFPQTWRRVLLIATVLATIVLALNLTIGIWSSIKSGTSNGVGTLYTGDCKVVGNWDTGLHLVINVFGTALLGASSFAMQCVSAPTRSEVDRAHAKGVALEIGVSSFTNLFHLGRMRAVIWFLLAISTLPLHLLWNGTIFSTAASNGFFTYVVEESFLNGAPYAAFYPDQCEVPTEPTLASVLDSYQNGSYSRLEPRECITAYSASILSERRNLIAVSKSTTGMRMSPGCAFNPVLQNFTFSFGTYPGWTEPQWNGSSVFGVSYQNFASDLSWLCVGWDAFIPEANEGKACTPAKALQLFDTNGTFYFRPDDEFGPATDISQNQAYAVDYCLSETNFPKQCQLQYFAPFVWAVVACNVVKVLCLIWTTRRLWRLKDTVFAACGDAVQSYLSQPDSTTRGWCWLGRDQVRVWKRCRKQQQKAPDILTEAGATQSSLGTTHIFYEGTGAKRISRYFNPFSWNINNTWSSGEAVPKTYTIPRRHSLLSAVSKLQWWTTITILLLFLTLTSIFLHWSIHRVSSEYSVSEMWNLGIGSFNFSLRLFAGETNLDNTQKLVRDTFIANSVQFFVSLTYFLYNALLTSQVSALEWSRFGRGQRRPLRVTWARGEQRSTYWLSMPFYYSFSLMAMSVLLHFFSSQSLFVLSTVFFNPDGSVNFPGTDSSSGYSIGYSPVAILVTICLGLAFVVFTIVHSLRPLDGRMPIHGNSSVVISAACHARQEYYGEEQYSSSYGKDEIAMKKIMWGAVVQPKNEFEVGHCSFTNEQVELPIPGYNYE